jgi:hypothetical protein
VVRKDPGPDGVYNSVDDGGQVTLWDYTSDYRGSAFVRNQIVNPSPAQNDRFDSFEVSLVKRPSASRWFATTAFLLTKNHRYLVTAVQSPNDEPFALDETWDWNYRLAAAYRGPAQINVSSLYTVTNGLPGQRTYIFRGVDPNGGAPIANFGNITQRLEPFGANRGPVRSNWNLKVSKLISLTARQKIAIDFDLLNVLNANPSWGTNYASGPTFGLITSVQPPRIARFGVAYEF